MLATALLYFVLASAPTQDQWRLVYQDGSVESAWGVPQLANDRHRRLQYAWVWSATRVPRRVDVEEVGKQRFPAERGRLEIRIAHPAGERGAIGSRVIAAPQAMWFEIPERSLPSWPVPANGRLAIPRDPGRPWRVRLAGPSEGTWWVDVLPRQPSLLLVPTVAKEKRVLVTDAGGEAVPGVSASIVEGTARGGVNRFWATLRAERGELELPGLPDREEVTLIAAKPGYSPSVSRGWPSELPDRLQLGTGAGLKGRVLDGRGKPIAAAVVEAESWASSQVPQLFRVSVRSQPDGHWTLAGVPAGPTFLSVRATGFSPFGQRLETAPGMTDLGSQTLDVGLALAVVAVDDQGVPVAGAKIEGGLGIAATSDGRGIATLAGVSPRAPLKLVAEAAHHLPGKLEINPPLPPQVRIELARAFTVVGRFLEAPNTPAAGGLVRIEQAAEQREARLDDEGRFDLALTPGEELILVLATPRSRELRLPLAAGAAGEVRELGDLVAPAGLVVEGRVVRNDGDGPVAGARIWLPRPGPGGATCSWAGRDLVEGTTGEDGRFRLTGLAPGPALLRVEAGGFARTHLSLVLNEAEDVSEETAVDVGDVRLSAGTTVLVAVDTPLSPGDFATARIDMRGEWSEADMLTAPVRDGEAMIRNVPSGMAIVSVLAGRKLVCERPVDVAGDGGQIEVDCLHGGVDVSGVVIVGGAAAGPGLLLWQPPPTATAARIDNVVSRSGLRQQTVVGAGRPQVDVEVGADGRFRTQDLMPGRWQVSWVPAAGVVAGAQAIDIPEVEAFDTVIAYPGLVVTGRVVDEEARPVEGARVRELRSGALAFATADGSFSLVGLGGARAVLEAQHEELRSPIVEVELEPDEAPAPVVLTLGKRAPAQVTVAVRNAQGLPAPGAFVFLEEEGKGARILSSSADGTVAASFQPPLPVRVRAAATTGGTWALGAWMSWEQAREGITLTLAEASGLVVESERGQGSPRLVSQNGWDLSWLLRLLGTPFFLSPEQPLHLDGLPPGAYTVGLDDAVAGVVVRAGELTAARLAGTSR